MRFGWGSQPFPAPVTESTASLWLSGCLVFAFRLALGPIGGRVFFVGFLLGNCFELGCFLWIERSLDLSGPLKPETFEYLFPLTFQYGKIWPPFAVLLARGVPFTGNEVLNNGMAAMGAGCATTGFLAGVLGLFVWYWLGGRRLFAKLTDPVRRTIDWTQQSSTPRRISRMTLHIAMGIGLAALVVSTWWRPFGSTAAIISAVLILTLLTAIGWLGPATSKAKSQTGDHKGNATHC